MQQPFPLLTDATLPGFPQQVVLGLPAGTNAAMAILWQQGSSALFSYVPLILRGGRMQRWLFTTTALGEKKNRGGLYRGGLYDVATVTHIVPLMTASAHIF